MMKENEDTDQVGVQTRVSHESNFTSAPVGKITEQKAEKYLCCLIY